MDLTGKTVLVVGSGISGVAATELLKKKNLTVSTAESCTGGSIAARLTSIAGSSEYFNGGIVAYSNEVKMNLLHVSPET